MENNRITTIIIAYPEIWSTIGSKQTIIMNQNGKKKKFTYNIYLPICLCGGGGRGQEILFNVNEEKKYISVSKH